MEIAEHRHGFSNKSRMNRQEESNTGEMQAHCMPTAALQCRHHYYSEIRYATRTLFHAMIPEAVHQHKCSQRSTHMVIAFQTVLGVIPIIQGLAGFP